MANNAADSLKMTPMTVIPTAVITDVNLCENSVLLYAYLASIVGPDGSAKFPGYKQVRKAMKLPKTWAVQTYLQQLEKAGWISAFNSRNVSNRYWLALRPYDFRV